MPTAEIRLDRALPEGLVPELERRLFFISSAITGFELVRRDGAVQSVQLALSEPDHALEADDVRRIGERINAVLEREIHAQKPVPPKLIWKSAAAPASVADVFPQLERDGIAFQAGEGQVAVGQPFMALMDYFDRRLRAIALSPAGALEYRYPTLLPASVLDRFGYFGTFPQAVMFVTRLHNDIDTYDQFLREYEANGTLTPALFAHCRDHDYCLPPTMCYHTYHQYCGRRLDRDAVVTSKGKSFRFESRYQDGLKRLWDFTIREIVFIGAAGFVSETRTELMRQTFALIDELGLSARCVVANDPFFVGPASAARIFSQRLMELKYELVAPVSDGESIAVASFNYHGPFFGQMFEIAQSDGRPAVSGCVGVGLERLTYAFLCRYGLDERGWPDAVRGGVA